MSEADLILSLKFRRLVLISACTIFSFFFLGLSSSVYGQTTPLQQGDNEFGVWTGFAPNSARVIGVTSHRMLAVVGFRYGRRLYENDHFSLEYTIDVDPVEFLWQPKLISETVSSSGIPTFFVGPRRFVFGAGTNPIGFKGNFFRRHRFQPFLASTAGLVVSTATVPDGSIEERRFNFTFDFQGGFQYFNAAHNRAWTLGYKLQHISNANRGSENPGVDLNVIFIGYSFYK